MARLAAMFDKQVVGDREQRTWNHSYRFICQIDAHLETRRPDDWRYTPADSKLAPSRKHKHYGYYFGLGPIRRGKGPMDWWIGFNRENDVLALRLYVNETEIAREWAVSSTLQATEVASDVLMTVVERARSR